MSYTVIQAGVNGELTLSHFSTNADALKFFKSVVKDMETWSYTDPNVPLSVTYTMNGEIQKEAFRKNHSRNYRNNVVGSLWNTNDSYNNF